MSSAETSKDCYHEWSIIEINHFTPKIHSIQCRDYIISVNDTPQEFSIVISQCGKCSRTHMSIINEFNNWNIDVNK